MTGFFNALPGAVAQGLVWGIMAIGVYITYKILDIADLSVDGSFCTGAAVCVVLTTTGWNIWAAMLVGTLAGVLAGIATGIFHTLCGIPAILAGILTQLGLWSINLAVMGMKANVALNVSKFDLVISLRYLQETLKGTRPFAENPVLILVLITGAVIALLYWFFGTELGASLRATGANGHMARAQGINTNFNKVLGLALSNGLVAFSGTLLCQYNGFAQIDMGRGAIVTGLAAIIIGDVIFSRLFRNFALKLAAVSIGAIIYYIVMQFVISCFNMNTNYLKLMSALIVALFLAMPYWQQIYFRRKGKVKWHA